MARGVAAADYDLDGDVDLAINNSNDVPTLLENLRLTGGPQTGEARSLAVELVGRGANTRAIGARMTLETEPPQTRFVVAGDSYQSSSSQRQYFSVPNDPQANHVVLEVAWPRRSDGVRRVQRIRVETSALESGGGPLLRLVEP